MALRAAALVLTSLVLGSTAVPAADAASAPADPHAIVISEVANSGSLSPEGGFFELQNRSDAAADLTGWSVYRCDAEGLRGQLTGGEVDLSGVVLESGAFYTAAHAGARLSSGHADAAFSQSLPTSGFGFVLVAPSGETVDEVAVYPTDPAPTQSECGDANIPMALAGALDESWQRQPDGRWLRARATPGVANAAQGAALATPGVRVDEIAAAGPGGHGDDFVELRNVSDAAVDLGRWRLYRCTAAGELSAQTLQHEFEPDARLAPGARIVIGGPGFRGADPAARTTTSLADLVSGVLLVTADGRRVDGVTVSSTLDTPCQTGDAKLAATLDFRRGESWQRQADGSFLVAPRTPGAANATEADALADRPFAYPAARGVAVSELADDPEADAFTRRNFVEVANYGQAAADVSGWRIIACGVDGFRRLDTLATVPAKTILAPGDAWLAALDGTAEARNAQAVFTAPLDMRGTGVWIEDAAGRRIDSLGVFHRNVLDESVDRQSPCTKGLAQATFAVDRLRGETYQRAGFTGDDSIDFVAAQASPGRLDLRAPADPAALARAALASATAAAPHLAPPYVERAAPTGEEASVLAAFVGTSQGALGQRSAPGERVVDPGAVALSSRDDGYDDPYLRLVVAAPQSGGVLGWSGRTVGRAEVRLSVWNPVRATWRALAAGSGASTAADSGADAPVSLSGRVEPQEVVDGAAELLVQVVPRTTPSIDGSTGLADPADYDLAVSHITDTQYYVEQYPEVYAAEVAWIAANADARKIAFATHTGDLVQNWVDPDQRDERVRREYATASALQGVLDDSGVPNSVLPGNHDSKRGVTFDLFNEFFPPDRYRDQPWYGGSIAPDDNRANWSAFDAGGAKFLMLSLPYAYGEDEIEWAQRVVASHTDRNVILSTHEHVSPKLADAPATRSNSSRWVSHADELWKRVIAPYGNVVVVLSGHFHGLGAIVTENAGAIPGHTVIEALADYQEFRTPTGERATGFQRLLQFDLDGGRLAVDTFSVGLHADAAYPYDYEQALPDNGRADSASNDLPWNVLAAGLQNRYTVADDTFALGLRLQFAKAVETDRVWAATPTSMPEAGAGGLALRRSRLG